MLADIGQKVTYVGANGLALAMKVATNISIAVQMMAFAESVVLAEKAGVALRDSHRHTDQQRRGFAAGAIQRTAAFCKCPSSRSSTPS